MVKVVALVSSGRYRQEHYEDVAEILRSYELTEDVVGAFADLFAADNPGECLDPNGEQHPDDCVLRSGFNRTRFLAACGLES